LAYLRVIANPSDAVSLERIVNVPPRGLGDSSIKQMTVYATASGIGLWDAMRAAGNVPGPPPRAVKSAAQFVNLVERWRKLASHQVATDDLLAQHKGIVQTVMEDVVRTSGLEALLRKEDDPEKE